MTIAGRILTTSPSPAGMSIGHAMRAVDKDREVG